jgi:hypothetical protein
MSEEATPHTVGASLAELEQLVDRFRTSNNSLAQIVGNQPAPPERPEMPAMAHLNARAKLLVQMLQLECNRLDSSIGGL